MTEQQAREKASELLISVRSLDAILALKVTTAALLEASKPQVVSDEELSKLSSEYCPDRIIDPVGPIKEHIYIKHERRIGFEQGFRKSCELRAVMGVERRILGC